MPGVRYPVMKRCLTPVLIVAALLALPAAASARVIELGAGSTTPAVSTCPGNPCRAIYQVTGYQGRSGNLKNPFIVGRDGYLVALHGRAPEAGRQPDRLLQRPLRRSARGAAGRRCGAATSARPASTTACCGSRTSTRCEDYLGSSPTFALKQRLRVNKGNIVAITVPTWLPALAADLSSRELVAVLPPEGRLRERHRALAALAAGGARSRSSATAAPTSAPGCSTPPRTSRIHVRRSQSPRSRACAVRQGLSVTPLRR